MQRRQLISSIIPLLVLPTAPASRAASAVAGKPGAPRTIEWKELVPAGWNPFKDGRPRRAPPTTPEGSPEEQQAMSELREIFDSAPTVSALDGQHVKLPGYVVPLDQTAEGLKEFLLVPYFGACMHTPPPPANQIVHVVMAKPIQGFRAMDTVWATGTMSAQRNGSPMGVSGYRLQQASIERYGAQER